MNKDKIWMSKWKNVKIELYFSTYAKKADLKNWARVDTLDFASENDFVNLKSDADKINIDKLENVSYNARNLKRKVEKIDVYQLLPVPVDLNKLSDVVKNDIVKKPNINTKY